MIVEPVITRRDGTIILRHNFDSPTECDHCGAESFYVFDLIDPSGATIAEGAYCTILCRDRAERARKRKK
jgi:hypothetical protein